MCNFLLLHIESYGYILNEKRVSRKIRFKERGWLSEREYICKHMLGDLQVPGSVGAEVTKMNKIPTLLLPGSS